MRTVAVIVRARRDQLDGVATEDDEVAEVLLPRGQVPGVVGMGLGPVAELMPTQRILGRGGDVQFIREGRTAALHVQFAQQSANAKQHAARIVTDDEYPRTRRAALDAEPVAFGATGFPHRQQFLGIGAGEFRELGRGTNRNDGRVR